MLACVPILRRMEKPKVMKVAHVVVGGEVAGGQVICERLLMALKKRGGQGIVISPTRGSFTERLREKGVPVYLLPFRL